MNHLVKVFAGIREAVGAETLSIEVLDTTTTQELKEQLAKRYPHAADLILISRLAIAHRFVPDEHVLGGAIASSDEIALIPPVSGG